MISDQALGENIQLPAPFLGEGAGGVAAQNCSLFKDQFERH